MINDLLSRLRELDIKIRVNGDELELDFPQDNLPDKVLAEIKKNKSQLIEYLKSKKNNDISKSPVKDYYPLSHAQKRLYFLYEFDKSSLVYNLQLVYLIEGEVDINKLTKAFEQIIQRQESLRTSFDVKDGVPVQIIHKQVDFKIEQIKINEDQVITQINSFVEPFDLKKAPLLRVGLLKVSSEKYFLVIDAHHIITDGISQKVLINELFDEYENILKPTLSLQYKDFAEWQNSSNYDYKIKKQREFWLNKFKSEVPRLNLPIDFPRVLNHTSDAEELRIELNEKITEKLNRLAKDNGATLFVLLLAAYNVLLSRLCDSEDVTVGAPITKRPYGNFDTVIGLFLNTITFRNYPKKELPFIEFLQEVKDSTYESYDNQEYQFESLIDDLKLKRDISRNPLFDTFFNFLNFETPIERKIEKLKISSFKLPLVKTKFDLSTYLRESFGKIILRCVYKKSLFNTSTIKYIFNEYESLLNEIVNNPNQLIKEFNIFNFDYNTDRKKTVSPKNNYINFEEREIEQTITERFNKIVNKYPAKIAIKVGKREITYNQLKNYSNALAYKITAYFSSNSDSIKGTNYNDQKNNQQAVALLLSHDIPMIKGILGVLASGNIYVPIDPMHPLQRIKDIIDDCSANLLITDNRYYDLALKINKRKQNKISIINIENIDTEINDYKFDLTTSPDSISYILYTSGSTGKPKGVVQSHRNVLHFARVYTNALHISTNDGMTLLSNYCFDASKMAIYGALLNGATLYPYDIRKEGLNSLRSVIDEESITIYHSTPSVYRSFIDSIEGDLKSVRMVVLGGESVNKSDVEKYKKYFSSDCIFLNGLGPTESTVTIQNFINSNSEYIPEKVPVGYPVDKTKVYIVNKDNKLAGVYEPGEIVYQSDYLALRYWNNKEATQKAFINDLIQKGKRYYRSGDTGRILPNGMVEFIGRSDNQVKIRGFKIELGEVEKQLLNYKFIKTTIVTDKEEGDNKYIIAYYISDNEIEKEEIRNYLSERLPDYMIPSYFVRLESIPLTHNGKIDRKALPLPEVKAGGDYVSPSNEIEEKLVEIWSEVLNISQEEISATDNFFSIGGHSLKATLLVGKIHKKTGVEFPLRDVFIHSNIQAQASQINTRNKKDFVSIPKAKVQGYYALSSAQKRLYLLQEMELESTAYNMPYTVPLGVESEKEKIEEAFRQLIKRHESFRTSFEIEGEEPVQRIHEQVEFKLEELAITKEEVQHQRKQFIQAFDLSHAPLLRATKVDVKGDGGLLMIDMHHIISDGVSHTILEQDFQKLLSGEELPPLKIQYKDFSEWQNSEKQQEKNKGQEAYWINKFEGELPVLDLPIDYMRPVIQSFEGATVSFVLNKEETQHIKSLAKENDLTLYMVLLSAFNILLSKLSGQEDIIVGTPIAGRNHSDLDNIVGMFVNTLAMRNNVDGDQSLRDYLQDVKQTTLGAFENQDYPFEELVEHVSVGRDAGSNPIFDVVFNLLNQAEYSGDLSELDSSEYKHTKGISKFDLTLTAVDYQDQLFMTFEYCTKLFKPETIESLIRYFKQLVQKLPDRLDEKLFSFEILSDEEKQELLYDFNETKTNYPSDKTIHQLFEEQVEQFPDKLALEFKNKTFTYQELNEESNKVANCLRERNVFNEQLVGLMVNRSSEMIIGILGILKSGGAYVPIDPEYPKERINHLIKDSGVTILLSTEGFEKLCDFSGEIIILDGAIVNKSGINFNFINNASNNLAYVMYTSGSTGKPKGVEVEHKNVVRLVKNTNYFPLSQGHKILQTGAPVFDATTFEIWGALLNGGCLHIPDNDAIMNAELFGKCVKEKSITTVWLTSSLFNLLADQDINAFSTLSYLLVGGDVLSVKHINKVKEANKKLVLINGYGPTENTTFSTTFKIEREYLGSIPIGKPISNSTAYILDKHNKIQPIGVSGELLVGGDGIARRYLNNPELTREKFIPHPFKEGERLYKTGDLAKWLPDGNIEFLGRIDHQVKIRGFRIEVGEIEHVLLKHENIKESVVLALESNGDKYLCAYIVSKEELNHEELRAYMSEQLPDYMVPSYFVELESLPLTTNGKVNRKVLPSPEIKAGDDYVAPSNEIEEKLVEIWSEVLNIDKDDISVNANFFSIGGHSLKATILTGKIYKEIGVEFPLREIFLHSTIKSQASQIEKSTKKEFESIPKAKEQSNYALSSAQKRLYLLQQIDLTSTAYNMSYIISLGKEVDKLKIEDVFKQLINRHESFRTSIILVEGEPVQVISKDVEFEIEELSIENTEIELTRNKFIKPFDLSQAPFLRAAIVDINGGSSLLMIDMHHIINDGASYSILEKEFQLLYSGEELLPLRLQYKDYSEWQNSKVQQVKVREQGAYWLKQFEGELPIFNLPTDYPKNIIRNLKGEKVSFIIDKNLTNRIRNIISETKITLSILLLAGYNILLSKYTDLEDIIVGIPIAGRSHIDLENIIGMFINMLAMRNAPTSQKTFIEFLHEVKQNSLNAYENQNFQFDELINSLDMQSEIGKAPLINTVFTLQNTKNISNLDKELLDSKSRLFNSDLNNIKFDLYLDAIETKNSIYIYFTYSVELFKKSTIEKFCKHYIEILEQVISKVNIKIKDIYLSHEISTAKPKVLKENNKDFDFSM